MMHPSESQLALFAGGELGWVERFRVMRHLRSCASCPDILERYRQCAAELNRLREELPPGLVWDRLANEMTGNIRVGLAAAECISGRPGKPSRLDWRPAAAMAMLTLVLAVAWWFNLPSRRLPAHTMRAAEGVVLQYTPSGLEVKENGNALTLMHPKGGQRTISVSSPGLLRVRYVDGDTGQITINNVYAE
jgi:hypothetical protein